MPKTVESPVRRRKLLEEIGRLTEVAVFGTLSETYRTCGNPGCHCRQGGPKHGPHLNISYRGENGKTTHRLLRSARGGGSDAGRSSRLAKTAGVFAGAGGDE